MSPLSDFPRRHHSIDDKAQIFSVNTSGISRDTGKTVDLTHTSSRYSYDNGVYIYYSQLIYPLPETRGD